MSKHHPKSLDHSISTNSVTTTSGCEQDHAAEDLSLSRRRLLQLMSVAGVLPGVALAVDQSSVGNNSHAEGLTPENCEQPNDLLIDIISSSAVPDDTVVITNNTAGDIELAGFLPSIIVFDNKFVDLGALKGGGQMILKAGQVVSFQTYLGAVRGKDWEELGGKQIQYVWAEDAMRSVSDEMQLVSVAGFVSGDQAILYSNTRRLTAAAVKPA